MPLSNSQSPPCSFNAPKTTTPVSPTFGPMASPLLPFLVVADLCLCICGAVLSLGCSSSSSVEDADSAFEAIEVEWPSWWSLGTPVVLISYLLGAGVCVSLLKQCLPVPLRGLVFWFKFFKSILATVLPGERQYAGTEKYRSGEPTQKRPWWYILQYPQNKYPWERRHDRPQVSRKTSRQFNSKGKTRIQPIRCQPGLVSGYQVDGAFAHLGSGLDDDLTEAISVATFVDDPLRLAVPYEYVAPLIYEPPKCVQFAFYLAQSCLRGRWIWRFWFSTVSTPIRTRVFQRARPHSWDTTMFLSALFIFRVFCMECVSASEESGAKRGVPLLAALAAGGVAALAMGAAARSRRSPRRRRSESTGKDSPWSMVFLRSSLVSFIPLFIPRSSECWRRRDARRRRRLARHRSRFEWGPYTLPKSRIQDRRSAD